MSVAPKNRQPWPMKWIVLAIVLVLVPYTFLTLRYRKSGPAFEPYHDLRKRANVSRLLAAGYQRFPISAQRPADGAPPAVLLGAAEIATVAGGLPADLKTTLVEIPTLPVEITSLSATAHATVAQPYTIQLTCTLADEKRQLGGADLYVREGTIVIAPTFEPVASGLETRTRQSAVLLTVPAGALKPGRYTVTLLAEKSSRTWALEVQ
jgi:hypothetical protein